MSRRTAIAHAGFEGELASQFPSAATVAGDRLTRVLGRLGLAEFVPMFLLALPAGQLADRFSRRLSAMAGAALGGVIYVVSPAAVYVIAGALSLVAAISTAQSARRPPRSPRRTNSVGLAVTWRRLFPALATVDRMEDLRPQPV